MKILQIFDDYGTPGEKALPGIGSVPSVVYYLAKYTAKKGHNVTILERGHDKNDPEEEYIHDVRYVRIRAEKLPAAPYKLIKSPNGFMHLFSDSVSMAFKINKFLKKENFDVIHVHFPFAACILVNLNIKIGEKMVYTAHIGDEKKRFSLDSKLPFLKFFSPDLYLMKRVKKSVVLNENIKYLLVAKGLKDEKLEIIPNGINVNEFSISKDEIERVREKYGLNETTVMFAGTITPRKGVDCLVKAAEIILKNHKDLTFLIVGNLKLDEEFANRVVKYVKERGLDMNIKFTDFVSYEDLRALYSACDVFVLPSFGEGDPVALKEALASGKPLIGSNVGGIPMQIRDGWNGFLIEPGNEKQLAEKIEYLIENEEERERMSKNSRTLAEEEFNWEKIAYRYIKVYEDINRC
jgi:glycosyltransferase involved in cell wall biosynthesis